MRSPGVGRGPRFEYQRQDSALTLAAGLEEYYRGHPGLLRPESISPDSAALFRRHDICHVIFGLDTTMVDEAMADLRTVLSTDVGVRRYVRYLRSNKDAQQIFEEVGYLRALASDDLRDSALPPCARAGPSLAKALALESTRGAPRRAARDAAGRLPDSRPLASLAAPVSSADGLEVVPCGPASRGGAIGR